MAVYDNKEEPVRRKKVPSAYRTAGTVAKGAARTALNTPMMAPARAAVSGYKETGRMLKQGLDEATAQPSAAARTGAALRTLATAPVAFAAGVGESVAEEVSPLLKGAKEFGRAFIGSPANDTASPESSASPSKRQVVTGTSAPPAVQASSSAPQSQRPGRRIQFGEQGQSGTGIITTPTGAVRYSPDGGIVRVGDPSASIDTSPAARVSAPVNQGRDERGYYLYNNEKVPVQRQDYTGRMVKGGGGFRLPKREEAVEPARRVSDIPEPKTIGEVPVYRRKVQALQSDINADQQQERLDRQQRQFEAQQKQQQEQFGITTALDAQQAALQGQQAEARTALEERRLAGDQQRQQAELDLKQRQEVSRQEAHAKVNEAIVAFSGAKTPEARRQAAEQLNILAGKGVQLDKKTMTPAWKPKEVSDALGDFREFFAQQKGEGALEEGATFFSLLQARDPGLYKAAYGDLSPGAADFGERVMTFPLEKLKADPKFKQLMETTGKGMTPEELQAALIADYVAGTQAGAAR